MKNWKNWKMTNWGKEDKDVAEDGNRKKGK